MRKLFVCFCICVILLWSAVFYRFGFQTAPRLLPDFLRNVDRLQPDRACGPLAVILVNSAPWHASLRQVIRETWGHPSVLRPLGLGLAFGVGSGKPLHLEAAACGDVLQYPGQDVYRNLPQKVAWLLRKVEESCDAPFVVKVDDDVFLNVHALQEMLLELSSEASEKKLWCLVWEGMPVIRANHSKWFVSRDSYKEPLYPTYCSGAGYILSSPALRTILQQENVLISAMRNKLLPKGTSQTNAPPSSESKPRPLLDRNSEENIRFVEGNTHSQINSQNEAPPTLEDKAHPDVIIHQSEEDTNFGVMSETKSGVSSRDHLGASYSYFGGVADDSPRPSEDRLPVMPKKDRLPVTSWTANDRPVVTSEDVYITGLLAGRGGVYHVQMGTRYAFESVDEKRISDGRTIFTHLGPEAEERIEEMWDWVQKYRKKIKDDTLHKGL